MPTFTDRSVRIPRAPSANDACDTHGSGAERQQDLRAGSLLDQIAALPGMDREQVLSFRIRAARYVDLLRSLVASYGNAMKRVREALQQRDVACASRIAHSLRGDAAVLGAAGLTHAAAELEAALRVREDDDDLRAQIGAVVEELRCIAQVLGVADASGGVVEA
jgi:two-component system, sensor histidine kinase and response regulator